MLLVHVIMCLYLLHLQSNHILNAVIESNSNLLLWPWTYAKPGKI